MNNKDSYEIAGIEFSSVTCEALKIKQEISPIKNPLTTINKNIDGTFSVAMIAIMPSYNNLTLPLVDIEKTIPLRIVGEEESLLFLKYPKIEYLKKERETGLMKKLVTCRGFEIVYQSKKYKDLIPYLITFNYCINEKDYFIETDAIITRCINTSESFLNPDTPRGTVTTSTDS